MGYFSDLDMENKEKPDESFAEAMYNRGKELEELEGKIFVHDWQYRKLGGFEAKLADLIQHADNNNQELLLLAFPIKVQAIMDYQSKEGWWAECERDVEDYRASFK